MITQPPIQLVQFDTPEPNLCRGITCRTVFTFLYFYDYVSYDVANCYITFLQTIRARWAPVSADFLGWCPGCILLLLTST